MLVSEKYRRTRGHYLMHFTHKNDVSMIKYYHALFSQTILNQKDIDPVHITNETSRLIDERLGYNNYVFLIFSDTHPFIYKQIINNVGLVCVKIDVSILDLPGVLIADRIATDGEVNFYTPDDALEVLNIQYCYDGRVNDKDIWNEVKKYEILIPYSIDLQQFLYKKRN